MDGPEGVCRMCGYTPIRWNYHLENTRTGGRLIVGSNCILNYRLVMDEMKATWLPVIFPPQFREQAARINEKRPGTVFVADDWPEAAYDELDREDRMQLGLDPTEEDEEEAEEEMLLELGLDPENPNMEDLAPHGMEAFDGDDDEHEDEDEGDEIDVSDQYDDEDDDDLYDDEDIEDDDDLYDDEDIDDDLDDDEDDMDDED